MTLNIEGFKRNKFYLASVIDKYNPLIIFLQEHRLSYHETNILERDFNRYDFLSTASDMFVDPEDIIAKPGFTWHGTAIGWSKDIDKYVSRLPVISERFCCISFKNSNTTVLFYSLYLPTSGKDEEFLEIIMKLASDINLHRTNDEAIIIGSDTNQSFKSSKRRSDAMDDFKHDFHLNTILHSNEATFHHNNLSSSSQIDHILYDTNEVTNNKYIHQIF